MASMFLHLVGFLVLTAVANSSENGFIVMEDQDEVKGLFEVMGSLLEDSSWSQEHTEPCTETPWPGVECEIGQQDPPIFHVTKIHIGPDILTPPCKSSANLSHSLLKLPYLKTLSIFNCFVSSPVTLSPSLFGAFSSLEHLAIDSNPALSGEIPPSLAEIGSLRVLTLAQNNLQGKIPSGIGGLVNLEQLDLSYNNLSGEIPLTVGGLTSLVILDVSWNGLEGQAPKSLLQLQYLQKIDLSFNKLVGTIPPDLGQLKRLELLDLSHNFLNGPIPESFSGLDHLQYLILDHNPINSGIPLFLGTLKKLTSISFSVCGLKGPIPKSLSSLKNLTALSLDNNSLSGTVPPDLGSIPNLDQLNLSHNLLCGELKLPEEFINRLEQRLDVRGNSGLCTSNKLYKKNNISLCLETPPCLGTKSDGYNKTCPDEEFPKEMQPSLHNGKLRSNSLLIDPK